MATEFDQFWLIYPIHIARKAAAKAFIKALTRAPLATILEGVERYKRAKPAWAAWMHGSTFLNGDRWQDDYGTMQRPLSEAEREVMMNGQARTVPINQLDPLHSLLPRRFTDRDGNSFYSQTEIDAAMERAN